MSYYRASQQNPALNDRTYQRGLRELLQKEFLYRSPEDDTFFVNIRSMFNGDHLARQGLSSQGCGQATYPPLP
jgi:hypothetical protein